MSGNQNKSEKKSASGYGIVKRGVVGALAASAGINNILGASAYDQSKGTGGGGFTLTPEGETEGTDVTTAEGEGDATTAAAALQTLKSASDSRQLRFKIEPRCKWIQMETAGYGKCRLEAGGIQFSDEESSRCCFPTRERFGAPMVCEMLNDVDGCDLAIVSPGE
ncbi:unnamed protein product [Amoebophrya sp. A120]|nr:unnamed protein product [Amoebophrya sp. A120]|eukprot:GSA120T00015620001.1